MKKILLLFILFSFKTYAQKDLYDYIITFENDTIYGKYRKSYLIDLHNKKHSINSSRVKEIKKNDCIYRLMTIKEKEFYSIENDSLIDINEPNTKPIINFESEIFARKLDENLRKDYLLSLQNDTIFGQIEYSSINSYKLIKSNGQNIKITPNTTLEYRKDGYKYILKEKRPVTLGDSKKDYLKLLIDGKVKLYEYTFFQSNTFYTNKGLTSYPGSDEVYFFIEKDRELYLINSERMLSILKSIIPEHEVIFEKIKKREFSYNDMYLIIKLYNSIFNQ